MNNTKNFTIIYFLKVNLKLRSIKCIRFAFLLYKNLLLLIGIYLYFNRLKIYKQTLIK